MFVCVYACMCLCMYVCLCLYSYVFMLVCVFVCTISLMTRCITYRKTPKTEHSRCQWNILLLLLSLLSLLLSLLSLLSLLLLLFFFYLCSCRDDANRPTAVRGHVTQLRGVRPERVFVQPVQRVGHGELQTALQTLQ